MRLNLCHVSLGFVLKFLNFLQCFVGLSILLYSLWMFNEWDHSVPPDPPLPPAFHFYLKLNSINLPAPWCYYYFAHIFVNFCQKCHFEDSNLQSLTIHFSYKFYSQWQCSDLGAVKCIKCHQLLFSRLKGKLNLYVSLFYFTVLVHVEISVAIRRLVGAK